MPDGAHFLLSLCTGCGTPDSTVSSSTDSRTAVSSQENAARIWTESNDGLYILPNGVSVDAASNEPLSSLAADIMTYADTCIPKFILGDMDIDAEWDNYLATMEQMGLSTCIAIEQTAYDTYIG